MNDDELLAYFLRMGPTERLAVLPQQLPKFLSSVDGTDLDIRRVGGVYYIKDVWDEGR